MPTAFCNHCHRYFADLLDHFNTILEHAMTAPNPDQSTIDSVTSALSSALPLLQAKSPNPVTPLVTDGLVGAAQAILDYANGGTTPTPATNDPR